MRHKQTTNKKVIATLLSLLLTIHAVLASIVFVGTLAVSPSYAESEQVPTEVEFVIDEAADLSEETLPLQTEEDEEDLLNEEMPSDPEMVEDEAAVEEDALEESNVSDQETEGTLQDESTVDASEDSDEPELDDTQIPEEDKAETEADDGAQITEGAEPSLSMSLQSASGANLNINDWNLAVNENIVLSGAFQAAAGSDTSQSAIITLPEYYTFDAPTGGTNYSVEIVSPQEIKVTFPAPASPANPETLGFSFKAKLDRTSINSDRYEEWQNGEWNPNVENTTFEFKMEDGTGTPVVTEVTITIKPYNGTKFGIRTPNIDAHSFRYEQSAWVSYTKPDAYLEGPLDANHIKITLPDKWYFPHDNYAVEWGKVTVSADKKTLEIEVTNLLTSGTRNTGNFVFWPNPEYVNGDNQNPENRFLANEKFAFKTDIGFVGTYPEDKHHEIVGKVDDYILSETAQLTARGIKDESDDKVVYLEVDSGEKDIVSNNFLAGIKRGPLGPQNGYTHEPLNNGAGYTSEVSIDENIHITQFRSALHDTTTTYGQMFERVRVSKIEYYTKDDPNTAVTVALPETGNTVTVDLPAGESVHKIVSTYEKLVYPSNNNYGFVLISNIKFDAPEGEPGQKFPINYTLKNAEAETIAEDVNYIMIKDELCPTFVMENHRDETMAASIEPGVYTKEGTGGYLQVGIKEQKVGGESGVKSSFTSPTFHLNTNNNRTLKEPTQQSPLYWSGRFDLHPVMGRGNWTVEVMTSTLDNVYNAKPENGVYETKVFEIPEFSDATTIDLYSEAQFGDQALDSTEIISGEVQFKHNGTFDYSDLSDQSDRYFFKAYYRSEPKVLHQGFYWGRPSHVPNNELFSSGYLFFLATFEDCTHIDKRHDPKSAVTTGYINQLGVVQAKGADILVPVGMETSYTGIIKQGAQTTIQADIEMKANKSQYAQLWSLGNEVAYFKLSNQQYVSFVPGSAKFDGVADPNASVATMDGVKYLKITNHRATALQKNEVSLNGSIATFEPWKISFDVYTLPTAPADIEISFIEDLGSWLDLAGGDDYVQNNGSENIHTVIQPILFGFPKPLQWIYGGFHFASTTSTAIHPDGISLNSVQIWDDPLQLYTSSAADDRNFALRIKGFKSRPEIDAVQGITLTPGLANIYSQSEQDVYPTQEDQMTTGINIIAGNSPMEGLTSTIKLPRSGDEMSWYPGKVTTVSQYLSGPIVTILEPNSNGSKPILVTYSVDGETFLSEAEFIAEGREWKDTAYIKLDNAKLDSNDAALLYIPLTTENAMNDAGGSNGVSYWEAVFKTTQLEAKSNRMNSYNYKPFLITGTVWFDANNDGVLDAEEERLAGIPVKLYTRYGTPEEELLGIFNTNDQGQYTAEARVLRNLTLIVEPGDDKVVTVLANDNKFTEDPTTYLPRADIESIDGDINDLNAGIYQGKVVQVVKKWNDADNQDGIRPDSATVKLLADGTETGRELILTESSEWTGKFPNLALEKDGKDIAYTVEEVAVDGYEAVVTGDAEAGFIVTNTHEPEKIDIEGKKTWDDVDNQDGKRPESITIRLLANGKEIATKEVTSDGWVWKFEDVDKFANGEEIVYTITEDAVEDYSAEVNGYDITNSYTPGKTSVQVTKSWKDNEDQDGIRPNSVTIKLLADGEVTDRELVLTEDNNWTDTFAELDEYKAGQKIVYTVEEVAVDGYEAVVIGDAETGFIVTNTHEPEETDPIETDPITISYDLNGGTLDGKTGILSIEAKKGEVITILTAPTKSGFSFTHWEGSKYYPGDSYTVTGDHTFTAMWADVTEPPEPETPTEPTKPADPGAKLPGTGDRTTPFMWFGVLLLSIGGLLLLPLRKRKASRD